MIGVERITPTVTVYEYLHTLWFLLNMAIATVLGEEWSSMTVVYNQVSCQRMATTPPPASIRISKVSSPTTELTHSQCQHLRQPRATSST